MNDMPGFSSGATSFPGSTPLSRWRHLESGVDPGNEVGSGDNVSTWGIYRGYTGTPGTLKQIYAQDFAAIMRNTILFYA